MEFNKVILIGNLTRDPESRFLPSGSQVCKMGLAVNRKFKSQGEQQEEVLFIDIECWNKTAELCAQYMKKGSNVLVEGRLKMDEYQTAQGEKRTKILVVADNVRFGDKNTGGGQSHSGGKDRGSTASKSSNSTGYGPPAANYNDRGANSKQDQVFEPSGEDDLPF